MGQGFTIAAMMVAASTTAAAAQGFNGAEVDINTSSYSGEGDGGVTTLQGSVEFGVTDRLAFALDAGSAVSRPGDGEAGTATLHVVYDLSPMASLGAFSAADESDEVTFSTYGAEIGMGFGASSFEGFVGVGNIEDAVDITVLGVDGTFGIGSRYALTSSFAYLDSEADVQLSRLGLGAEARLGQASTLYLEVGQDDIEGETAEYVGLGARFAFGRNRGTTFDPRGVVELFSGL